jgi:hypothetical protein
MKLIKLATATALVAFSAGSFAAKPTSIVFVGNAETGDEREVLQRQEDGTDRLG